LPKENWGGGETGPRGGVEGGGGGGGGVSLFGSQKEKHATRETPSPTREKGGKVGAGGQYLGKTSSWDALEERPLPQKETLNQIKEKTEKRGAKVKT